MTVTVTAPAGVARDPLKLRYGHGCSAAAFPAFGMIVVRQLCPDNDSAASLVLLWYFLS